MIGFFYFVSAIFVILAVYVIFQAIGGVLAGAKIDEISFFSGKPIFSFKFGQTTFRVNRFPNGSSVKFTDDFQNLHPLKKILAALFGLASYVVIAAVGLGATEAAHQIFSGYGQLFRGALSPVQIGSKLIAALLLLFAEKSFGEGLGILAAKFFAFNSLPFGLLNGGFIILCLLELVGYKSEKFSERFQFSGLFIAVLMFLSWTIAFAVFLWETSGNY